MYHFCLTCQHIRTIMCLPVSTSYIKFQHCGTIIGKQIIALSIMTSCNKFFILDCRIYSMYRFRLCVIDNNHAKAVEYIYIIVICLQEGQITIFSYPTINFYIFYMSCIQLIPAHIFSIHFYCIQTVFPFCLQIEWVPTELFYILDR